MGSGSGESGWCAGLLGRGRERAELDGLISDVRRGQSRSLVLWGEAGIGKTALLEYLIESASDMTVARAIGVESEMELPYASLHQMCVPLLGRVGKLPAPRQQALEIVFGLSAGTAPDRFLVGLGVLTLLSEAAEERPLLCVVDDAQWLDHSSALTLAFVARRLLAEPVGLVFAAREPGDELQPLAELKVSGVSTGDARAILSSAVPFMLDAVVRDRIIAETRGNPLALLELPRELTATELVGGFGVAHGQGVSGRIEESFAQRLHSLPDDTRRLLLLAAAEPVGDPVLLLRASDRLDISPTAAEEAEAQGLVTIGARVAFRHPLVRSAAYRSASGPDRRAAHLALAEVSNREVDPDRRAWHLAVAATGPDEDVASELERSAGRAQARGGLVAAAAFLQRAAALTEDPARRADRALAAAQVSVQAGAFDSALELLTTAETGPPDESRRAVADLVRAQLAFASGRGAEAPPLLLAAARRLEPLDPALACETYVDAFSAALFGARLNFTVTVSDIAGAARLMPREAGEPTLSGLLLQALISLNDDYAAAVPRCREALQALLAEGTAPRDRMRWLWLGCVLALELWDDDSAYLLSQQSVQTARDTVTLSELALALSARTPVLVFCGEFGVAAETVAETQSVEEATGISSAPYGRLILNAWQGRSEATRELAEATRGQASSRGEGIGIAISEYARAVLSNGLGRYEEALAPARAASGYQEVVAENWCLGELVEAAVRTGRIDLAEDALTRLASKTRAAGTDWALGMEARSRALLGEQGEADARFRDAIDRLSRTRVRAELARTHLLYGEWLRRKGRRADARAQLRIALDLFTSIGMAAFAERARSELLAIGEKAGKRTVERRDDLTSQERQIAHMARDGLSNPEIGARLFLSPRTVEWHLHKVFGKLGIRSRHELVGVLASAPA